MGDPVPDVAAIVLLIDDQPVVGEAVRRALAGQAGIALHYCSDPALALSTAASVKPTVILQDLVMPGVDGLSLVRRYRDFEPTRDVPIVVLSAQDEPRMKSAAFTAGASDYLVKLPDAIELVARVRHHSRGYQSLLQRDEAYRALRESQRQLQEANVELQRLTNVDGLTGLSNRRYFNEFLGPQWNLALREQRPFSVLMIDVDDFKRYNDTYGHPAGDEVLRSVAAAIHRSFRRPTDLAARIGGEEFAVILPATPLAAAQALGDRVREAVAALSIPHGGAGANGHVTVSVGGAGGVPQQHDGFLPLLEAADGALYEAKRSGKNRVVVRAAAGIAVQGGPAGELEH